MTLTVGESSGLGSMELMCCCLAGRELVELVLDAGALQGIIIVFVIEGHISVVAAAMLCCMLVGRAAFGRIAAAKRTGNAVVLNAILVSYPPPNTSSWTIPSPGTSLVASLEEENGEAAAEE